jgi:hypothetical protein
MKAPETEIPGAGPFVITQPVSEGVRTGLAAISREQVHIQQCEDSHAAKEEALQAQRRKSGKPGLKRFFKTLP